jgi:hypothetical protein
MKKPSFKKFTTILLTTCAVIFGLALMAAAAVKPELISKAQNGDYANNDSRNFSLSADGRFVVFHSTATNLVGGITDANNSYDVFLRDAATGTIRCLSCVSAAEPTSTGNKGSFNPIISADGRYVVFVSLATDLVGGIDINNDLDVFRFDTVLNQRELISINAIGSTTGNSYSGIGINGRGYDMSDDGRYVAFVSNASDLTGILDTNGKSDVFLRDMETHTTRFISRNLSGNAANNESFDPSISADGHVIAYTSLASDLLAPGLDGNLNYDIFVYNTVTEQLRCASMSTRRDIVNTGNSGSVSAVISKDGNRVAYFTFAIDVTNIPIPFGDPYTNVVVHDIGFNQNALVSVNVAGTASGNNESGTGSNAQKTLSISANGRYVTFESKAGNLSPVTTTSSTYNVFRRDLAQGRTEVVSINPAGAAANQNAFIAGQRDAVMSRDGRFVTFSTTSSMAADFPSPGGSQIYVRDMLNGVTTALTLNNAGTALGNGNFFGGSSSAAISANGKAVVFLSQSTDLTPTPTTDAFLNLFRAAVPTPQKTVSDFDGDGLSDFAVFRPQANGTWYILNNSGTFASYRYYGAGSDLIAPADFTGDGRTDYTLFRPSSGSWYILDENYHETVVQFGLPGDKPIPQDFDGDGRADVAVYRNGSWWWQSSQNGQATNFNFGLASDIPVQGDFDGDGKADYAVFRPSNGTWYARKSSDGNYLTVNFGLAGDKPVAADYDGDGKTDIAVFRSGIWYILRSRDLNVTITQFGLPTDVPAVGSYDADGKADIAVFRPNEGNWYVLRSSNNAFSAVHFGQNGDMPVPSAFVP